LDRSDRAVNVYRVTLTYLELDLDVFAGPFDSRSTSRMW
jgi:hypothetical protein